MKKEISFNQFEVDLMRAIAPLIQKTADGEQGSEVMISLGRFLIDGEKMPNQRRIYTPAEKYKLLIFDGFAEISASFHTLRDIEIMFRSITSRPSKTMKSRLLSYHVHSYLNENYILKSRLERYPVTILRASKRLSEDGYIIEPIKKVLAGVFGNIVATRGRHVHDKRYSDDDLERLFMLELTAENETNLGKALHELFKVEFTICRGKWLERMKTNNNVVEELMGVYFTILHPFIFDDTGEIIVPNKIAGA